MEIITGTTKFHIDGKSAVAIGKFDGVHLGHKKLLKYILEQKKDGLKSVVFTFDPSPEEFFTGHTVRQLFTKDEKRREFKKLGIDILIEFPLTEQTAATEPEDFVRRILVGQINADYIAAGTDVTFGAGGRGDQYLLKSLAGELFYELALIDKVRMDGAEVSSTRVRNEVADGNMVMAERLLGSYYSVSGIVEHGRHIGHTIGIPTVNILPPEDKLLPPFGVYSSKVHLGGKVYDGMTNIGRKPTISEKEKVGVETYIYDYDGDAYGEFIEVELLRFVRPEMKFDNLDMLKAQINSDLINSRN
ncbi:bifunctional riboflavin kinase/FAD synthetase [Butyrivibrio sp. XPD2006]|uniref:bifunctional riboflavin kinase/FAD synthetase n=1 Tax=Butyrivibrio sp. XPD2006 TaxID=1280668 RepID=UPI0003B6A735|nr:bifunctional riboflavin kinase/FAD synthetase [Butyrivibrio sp. XPD2006]